MPVADGVPVDARASAPSGRSWFRLPRSWDALLVSLGRIPPQVHSCSNFTPAATVSPPFDLVMFRRAGGVGSRSARSGAARRRWRWPIRPDAQQDADGASDDVGQE